MDKVRPIERRLRPSESPVVIGGATVLSILLALFMGGFLFLPFGASPIEAYGALLHESFGSLSGFGFTLVKATPLIFIALGTAVAWRSGFFYLGFQGTFYVGAAAAAWVALLNDPTTGIMTLAPAVFFPVAFLASFLAGGTWASIAGVLRVRFGGNEVIVSLMMNYVAAFFVSYLVSGPLRAPADLPQTPRLPTATTLPFVVPGTRAHAGLLVALAAAFVVWFILRRTPAGYEWIVTGLNARAARYGGIDVPSRQLQASFIAGGLGALAGLSEVLGVQYRLMDGMGPGIGFVGIVVGLLGKLHPIGVTVASVLYAAMDVGADAMQRRAGVPSSVVFIVQSLIVLLILASDILRYYRIHWKALLRARAKSPESPPSPSRRE